MRTVESLFDPWVGSGASRCGASRATPAEVEDSTPDETAGASPGEIEGVASDDGDTPASCDSL